MAVIYQEQKLEDVIAYWTKDYSEIGYGKILKIEHFIDVQKGIVVFKIYTDKKDNKSKQ